MNYGMKVVIKYNDKHLGRVKLEVMRNVTEIHYNFESDIKMQIAFESGVHKTGCTRMISEIEEFESILETEKAEEF